MRPRKRHANGRRWLARAGYAGLGMACLLLAAITFLFVAAPGDIIRDRIVEQVKARTGRDLVAAGPVSLSLFPRLAVRLSDVSLSAPPDMEGGVAIAMQSLDIELGFWSLLTRQRPAVQRLVIAKPAIELMIDAQGRRSWDISVPSRQSPRAAADGPVAHAQAEAPGRAAAVSRNRLATLESLLPIAVSISDATVRYRDERTRTSREISALDVDLVAKDPGGPLEATGSVAWRGEKLAFEARLSPIKDLIEQQKSRLALKLVGRPLEATYEGTAGITSGLALDGNVSVAAPSAAALGAWLGKPLSVGRGSGALKISSPLKIADGEASLPGLEASLGDTSLTGAVTVQGGAARPYVKGSLTLAELDLGALLLKTSPSLAPASGPPGRRAEAQLPEEAPQRSTFRGPQVRGFTRRDDGSGAWSDDVIDFALLGLADADLQLAVERLVFKEVKTGPSRLSVAIRDMAARVILEEIRLYGGRGQGALTLDGAGQVPTTGLNLTLEGISALPLLKDAIGLEWLSGRCNLALALIGQGVSERQIVESFNGKVEMRATNGAILGVDIARILRNLEEGQLTGLEGKPGEKTQFTEFAGTFPVAHGVAQNQDLRIASTHIRVTGAGNFDLAQRRIDYTARPKIVESAAGQSAAIKLTGLEVPLRIEGPWEKPSFTPDLNSVLKSEQTGEVLKRIGKNLKSPEVQDAIKGLLGGGEGQQKVKPRELLDKLLKKE